MSTANNKQGRRPLDGVMVLELVQKGPGAYATMMLADMGADVIKIETPPRTGESGSGGSASAADARAQAANMTNRGKRSLVLDLKDPFGQQVFQKLAARATVIVEGFRPGVTQRLKADYDTLRASNPGLIYCSMSGYGQSGPYRDLPAHDLNFIGTAGVLNFIGPQTGAPVVPPNLIADYGGAALHAVAGISMALLVRHQTGQGQLVDISYLDSAMALMTGTTIAREYVQHGRDAARGDGPLAGHFPYYTVYETRDGKHVTVGTVEPWLWKNLCLALERPDLVEAGFEKGADPHHPGERQQWCRAEMTAIFKTRDRDDWLQRLSGVDTCFGPVNTLGEAFADPQLRARDMVVPLQHPQAGEVLHLGVAIKLSETPGRITGFAPWKGQHTKAILTELGYDA
jgi:crotonobetainyl-CoA:carnitine CoA-transferase CaiB-like acyl-CoA transferase